MKAISVQKKYLTNSLTYHRFVSTSVKDFSSLHASLLFICEMWLDLTWQPRSILNPKSNPIRIISYTQRKKEKDKKKRVFTMWKIVQNNQLLRPRNTHINIFINNYVNMFKKWKETSKRKKICGKTFENFETSLF